MESAVIDSSTRTHSFRCRAPSLIGPNMGYPIRTEETAVFRLQDKAFEQVAVRTYPDHITPPISWDLSPQGDYPSAGKPADPGRGT